jgi:hypothetical protein
MSITIAEKTQLEELGFRVEDMHEVHGDGWWSGMYRWTRTGTGEFQDDFPNGTQDRAWQSALAYAKQMGYVT